MRERSDFIQALSTFKTFTPRSWRRPTRAHTLLEVQTMENGIEFLLYLVAMERILVVFLRIQRKSRKKRQAKACDRTEQPVVYRTLVKTSDEWLSRIHSIFVTDRSFTVDGSLLLPTGSVNLRRPVFAM